MSEPQPLLERIVARVADVADDKSGLSWANATLISSTLAVTAFHVIEELNTSQSGEKKVLLDFAAAPQPFRVRATVVAGDASFDFAVLRLDTAVLWELPSPLLAPQVPPTGAEWECLCFVSRGQSKERVRGRVKGLAEPIGDMRPLRLDLATELDDPTGASGAPVVVKDQVVGIVGGSTEQEDAWLAIPFAEMARSTVTTMVRDVLQGVVPKQADTDQSPPDQPLQLDEVDLLRRLSPSSRRALSYANMLRTTMRQSDVHMEHLILGLFEKQDGPTRSLLLSKQIDETTLRSLVAPFAEGSIPADAIDPIPELIALPPHSRHVREALIAARKSADERQSDRIQSRHLLYGVLSVTDCRVVKALLDKGARIEDIVFEEPRRHDPNQPLIAAINNDLAEGPDRLNILRDVRALCSVIAARDVEPPVSIGLFGDWGSGKSFFMRQMREEIKTLKGDFYCTNIVQLEFNAWYYVDKDLWASLASEIFEKLAEKLAEDSGLDAELRRARLLAAAASSKDVLAEAERKKHEADAELQATEQRLARLQERKSDIDASLDKNLRAILRTVYVVAREQPEIKQQVDEAAAALKVDNPKAAMEVKGQLLELRKDVPGYFQATLLAIRQARKNWLLLVALILVGLVLLTVNQILASINASGLFEAASYLLSALVSFGVILSPFIERGRRALNIVDQTRQAYADEIANAKLADEKAIESEQRQLQGKVIEAQRRVDEASKAAKELDQQLDDLRADRRMSNFIKERNASTDYTKHFGTVARARNDFERLADLLKQARDQRKRKKQRESEAASRHKEGLDAGGEQEPRLDGSEEELDLPTIDRIILYIDDLDRCPEDKVFAVLQAVHLLLAFPLFVVVVGVDPRWLLHSLKRNVLAFETDPTQVDGMQDEGDLLWESTPLNYLDKIFQIPFTLRPMDLSGFGVLIESLTQPKTAAVESDGENSANESVLGLAVPVSHAADDSASDAPNRTAPDANTGSSDGENGANGSVPSPTEPVSPADGSASDDPNRASPEASTGSSETPVTRRALGWVSRPASVLGKILLQKLRMSPGIKVVFPQDSSRDQHAAETPPADVPGAETQVKAPTTTDTPAPSQSTGGSAPESATVQGSPALIPHFLTIEEPERLFMKQLYRLIPSPRAAKRFVNVYRLLRASVEPDQEHEFIGDATWGRHRPVLLLLAILTGYPNEATDILHALVEQEHHETWWEFVRSFEGCAKPTPFHNGNGNQSGAMIQVREPAPLNSAVDQARPAPEIGGTAPQNHNGERGGQESNVKLATGEKSNGGRPGQVTQGEARRWRELLGKLEEMRVSNLIPGDHSCQDFVEWAPRVARYSFQSGRVLFASRRQDPDN